MKFSGKMRFGLILKVTKKLGFTLSLEETFSKNHRGGQFDRPRQIRVRIEKQSPGGAL